MPSGDSPRSSSISKVFVTAIEPMGGMPGLLAWCGSRSAVIVRGLSSPAAGDDRLCHLNHTASHTVTTIGTLWQLRVVAVGHCRPSKRELRRSMSEAIEEARPTKTPLRAALSSWTGSALEYYDFAVSGTAAALVLNTLFFPETTAPGISILVAMGTVGVAYVVRPLGALIMGPLGDRFGRKFVLMLTLFMMGVSTFVVGCLPTYDQVGILAPILLVLCRIVQGLSASGEQASAISVSLEHAAEAKRAWTTSWTLHGTQAGTLLATAVFIPFTTFLPDEAPISWGWRVPFWLSALVVLTAWLIRRGLEEPPAFKGARVDSPPLMQVFRWHKAAVLRVATCGMVNTVNMVFTVWSLSFATSIVGLDRSTMLLVSVIANAVALLAIPAAALLSDRIGRKPVFIIGAVGAGVKIGRASCRRGGGGGGRAR